MTGDSSVRIESGVVIHGGVGTIPEADMADDLRAAYSETLRRALAAGHDALGRGGALDGVIEAVAVLEDSPLFNAGRGSNFDERGVITMDASVMVGTEGTAGAVAAVTGVRSPVRLARAVMEQSTHVFLVGDGAEAFARARGLVLEDPAYFHTDRRWQELEQARAQGGDARPNVLGDEAATPSPDPSGPSARSGTVGAVALDPTGVIAAATSTGGMANKSWGRVGDSPVIGAGTWAGPLCAISCTGWGELFIRQAVAHDVHARMEHGGATLRDAVHAVIWDELHGRVPRSGGLVAIDREGHVELCFNTPGMYRGWVDSAGRATVGIHGGAGR